MLTVVISIALMSFVTNSKETIEPFTITGESLIENNEDIVNSDCYWEETFGSNVSGKRGASCGSDTSIKVYFTNPYSYSVRVAFYLRDTNGNLGQNAPYVVTVRPGKTRYHHNCYSNGNYIVLAAKANESCGFPTLY